MTPSLMWALYKALASHGIHTVIRFCKLCKSNCSWMFWNLIKRKLNWFGIHWCDSKSCWYIRLSLPFPSRTGEQWHFCCPVPVHPTQWNAAWDQRSSHYKTCYKALTADGQGSILKLISGQVNLKWSKILPFLHERNFMDVFKLYSNLNMLK